MFRVPLYKLMLTMILIKFESCISICGGGNWLFILPKFGKDLFLGVHSFLVASNKACNPRYPVLVCLYGQFLSDLLPHLD